jgi:PAS domain S-box-containing protein
VLGGDAAKCGVTALITTAAVRDGFFCCDGDWRFTEVNEEAERLLGKKRGELLGKVFWEEYADALGTEVERVYRQAAADQSSLSLELYYPALHAWFDVRVYGRGHGCVGVSFHDLTPRKVGEQSWRDSEELLRLMVESVKDYAIFALDPERRVTSWNTGAERLFGYAEGEIFGQSGDILYTPEDQATGVPETEAAKALKDGRAEDKRWHIRKDGSRFFATGMVRPMRDEGGTFRGFTKIAHDITESRRAETALQQQANLLDLSHDAIFAWQLGGTITYWNRGAEQTYGFEREEATGRNPQELLKTKHPNEPNDFIEHLKRESKWSGELCHTCKDGSKLLVESRQIVIQRPNGESIVLESNRDITERNQAEEALREREAQLQLAISIAQMGTFDIDLLSDEVRVNDIGRAIYGWAPNEPGAFSAVQTHFHPEDRDEVMQKVRGALHTAGSGEFGLDQRIIRTDGAIRWIRVLGQAFFQGEGPARQAVRCIGTYTDITPLREAEETLRETNRRKDEFLAMLAHELRNPLSAIRSALLVSDSAAGDADAVAWAKGVVDRQSAQLARLVDDLLDVARITSGKIRLQKALLPVAPLLDQAAEVVRPIITARRHEFVIDYERGGALLVDADATRLEQIVVNLLTNAAKYTEPCGKIWLSARREEAHVIISVRDSGVGIAAEKLPEMFELFAQGERSIARSEGGLGLGLTIVRTLVDMHGGTVQARSEGIGQGCEFIVRLPVVNAPKTIASQLVPEASQEAKCGATVLVVDDNVDSAEGIARLIRRRGYTVSIAHDGPDAINAARILRPHFVLLDIGLPGMDGYEVASKLRKEICCEGTIYVAITGYGQEEDRRRSKEAGFNHHLIKPIDFAELIVILTAPKE